MNYILPRFLIEEFLIYSTHELMRRRPMMAEKLLKFNGKDKWESSVRSDSLKLAFALIRINEIMQYIH